MLSSSSLPPSTPMNIWTGKLMSEAKFGHVIIVGGTVKPHPIKISIDFAETNNAEHTISDNIILHLSVRFNEKQIIRSSHFAGVGWSDEQISDNLIGKALKNPVKPGKPFTVRLTILQAIFQVHINDELYCTYDHNRPLHEIKFVRIKHDFERINQFDHRLLFPQIFPIQFDYDTEYSFSSDVPAPLRIGTSIVISGLVAGDQEAEFSIDLFSNDSMLVVARFNPQFARKMVVRNTQRLDGRFYTDDEERVGPFPFKRGEPFSIGIAITREAYQFFVNGRFYTYYNHRGGTPNELAILKCWAPAASSTELTITGLMYNDGPINFKKLTSIEMSE